ncbi:IS3 family transposase [Streptococcus orisratti]|uniref:IS3 family transposase n=1 Tax=Streptococcus orisratti TaxID=114652 RepID=UPI000373042B
MSNFWGAVQNLLKSFYKMANFNLKFGIFHSLEELILKTKNYVHWWNHHRIHSSLNYQTPIARRAIA